jgi:hypothetical protein
MKGDRRNEPRSPFEPSGDGQAINLRRTESGVRLPKLEQVNFSAKLFLFAGIRLDAAREYSNYKRFATAGDEKLDAPKIPPGEP